MCTSPLLAFRLESGDISFSAPLGAGEQLNLPCGQCIECRLERSRQWAVRCVHESKMHEHNCFITLTYSPEHLPENSNLQYRDFQLFMKRLRKFFKVPVRFYMCGEYGTEGGRPHYHACLFGVDFSDKKYYKRSGSGSMLYQSDVLSKLWGLGNCDIGELNFESAAYCSRYITTKVLGPSAKEHYRRVNLETGEIFDLVPEFTKMSLKPGIGTPYYLKWLSDIFPHDRVVIRGKIVKPPRYYALKYAKSHPDEWDDIQYRRFLSIKPEEQTETRLRGRAVYNVSKLSRLPRKEI